MMADGTAKDDKRKRARIAAALSVAFVALFAMAFVGLILLLNNFADKMQADAEPTIATHASLDPFYVLLIGSDSRRGTAVYTGKENDHAQVDQHSDIMTLMRVDPINYKITLVSVPRDTTGADGKSKINDALLDDDPHEVVKAVANLTGVYPDYYMMTSFISFENLINALGGINVDVPKTVSVVDPATGKKVTVKAGENKHLNGAQALVLARARDEYDVIGNSEGLRQVNVRNIERAMIEKVLKQGEGVDVMHVITALSEDTKSNMSWPDAGYLIQRFAEHADEVTITDGTGPYEGDMVEELDLWLVPEDKDKWEEIMDHVDEGGDPKDKQKPPEF